MKKIGIVRLIRKIRAVHELIDVVVEFVEYAAKHVKTDAKVVRFTVKIRNLIEEIKR